MARVRWADLGPDEVPAEVWQQPAAEQVQEDAWGPEDESHAAEDAAVLDQQPARAVSAAQQTALAALLSAAHRQPLQPEPLQNRLPKHLRPEVPTPLSLRQQQQPQQQQVRMYQVPSLHQLCCTVLAQHVTAVVEQLQEQVQWLPTDVRAALLAVARWGKVSAVPACHLCGHKAAGCPSALQSATVWQATNHATYAHAVAVGCIGAGASVLGQPDWMVNLCNGQA